MSGAISRLRKFLRLVRRVPTVLRTLRWLRAGQAWAQLHHLVFGLAPPRRLAGADGVKLALTSATTAFLPPPAHVKATAQLEIELLATPFALGETPDWACQTHGPLFAYHLHQHDYLRSPELSPAQRVACMSDWIDRNPEGVGWDPHPISLRLLSWGKMLLGEGMLDFEGESKPARDQILRSMADQAATLDAGLETRLQANHLLSNLISVVWAGLLIEAEAPADSNASAASDSIAKASAGWRGRAPQLIDEIRAQVHPDGGHEERSPMYHSLILENLLDLLNVCRAAPAERVPSDLVPVLEKATTRMLVALSVLTHPDGRIALFADSGFDIAAEPSALRAYAARLGVGASESSAGKAVEGAAVLPFTGYARLVAGPTVAVVSTSGPAPPHQPGHAHCDALSLELSIGERRVLTDTGLYEYLPGVRRDLARATASHATLQIDGQEQAELWSAHRIGGRPEVRLVGWDGGGALEATCRGWSRRGALHTRAIELDSSGVTIIDALDGDASHVRLTWPFDPVWRVELETGRTRARASLDADADMTLTSDSARSASADSVVALVIELSADLAWRVERGVCFPSLGREVERDVLVGEVTLEDDSTLTWSTRIHAVAPVG